MQKILLIGGGGYVGNSLAHYFLKKKHQVTILDNFIYNHKSTLNNLISFSTLKVIEEDILNRSALKKIINNCDIVIVLAGLVGDPITKKYPEYASRINDLGVKNSIDITFENKIRKLIFISTCSNYGLISEDKLADEQHPLNPISLYAKSKVDAEKYIMSFENRNIFTSTTILRFATAFGVSNRMRFDLTINHFVKDALIDNKLVVYDSDTWRPYCHLQDFNNIIEKVIFASQKDVDFQIFNAGSEINNYTKEMIVKEISKKFNNLDLKIVEGGHDRRNYKVDFNKIKKTLNFKPIFSVNDGIEEIIQYIKNSNDVSNFASLGNFVIKK